MRKHILTSIISLTSITSAHAAGVNIYIPVCNDEDTLTTKLPDLEVKSANQKKEVRSSTPLHNIDSEKIRTTGITDISDAMRRMPGVNLRDYGGAGGLKTVSVRGLGSEHTAVVYDGVTLSDCQSGQIDLARYSIDNVKGLTLFSGDNDDIFIPARAAASSSSLYISSFTAPTGDEDEFHLKAQMKTGSFGYYNPYLRISDGNGKGLSFSSNVEYIHSENDYPFTLVNGNLVTREKRENSRMNSWTGELNGRWRINGASSLVGKVYYYDNSRDLPGQVIYYVNESEEHLRERNFFGQLQYRGKLSSKFSLLATGKFNWATSRYTDVNGKYPGGKLDNYYIQRETYFTGALLYTPMAGLSIDYSADWAWNNLSSNLKSDIRPYRNTILQSLAMKYNFWRISAMARALYSIYFNDAKDGDAGKDRYKLSPSVSVSMQPAEDLGLFVRASYKNIFRMPTFNEAYFDNLGSINLDPESTDQLNVGITFQAPSLPWMSDLTLTCDGYINHVKNKIVAIPYNLFLWKMENLGKVRVYGLDVSLSSSFELTRNHTLMLSGSYSYQRAQPRTDPNTVEWMKQVAYIPLNSGSASVSWLNPWVNVALHGTGCSARYTTNQNFPETRISGYFDTGISLFRSFKIKKNSLEIKADILNIFDKQYEIVARYPMPGRSWKLTAEFEI